MNKTNKNLEQDLREIKLMTFNTITSLTELNKRLLSLEKDYSRDDYIILLWNKGLNKNQISKKLGLSYSTIYSRITTLLEQGKIRERGRQ